MKRSEEACGSSRLFQVAHDPGGVTVKDSEYDTTIDEIC